MPVVGWLTCFEMELRVEGDEEEVLAVGWEDSKM
jgi:hypothetical protein